MQVQVAASALDDQLKKSSYPSIARSMVFAYTDITRIAVNADFDSKDSSGRATTYKIVGDFVDGNSWDGNREYSLDAPGCEENSKLKIRNNVFGGSSAEFIARQKSEFDSTCIARKFDVTLTNVPNRSQVAFKYTSADKIEPLQTDLVYGRTIGDRNKFIANSSSCTYTLTLSTPNISKLAADCKDNSDDAFNKRYSNVSFYIDNSPEQPAPNTGSSGSLHDSNATCLAGGSPLNWILCPIFNIVADFSDFLFRFLFEPMLRTSPISTDPDSTSYQIWSAFRIYGNIFLVIALLVIVFGQSIGGGLVDAYTAKKVLPRLLAASILINLSIYIVAFAVDITNIIGGGLGSIITEPLNDAGAFNITPSGVQAGVIGGVPLATLGIGAYLIGLGNLLVLGGGAILGALPLILLFIVMPVVFGLLVAFITLVFRQGILLALVLVSPIAFALYCLPNTEKYFQKWWSLFIKTLAVYPIVILIFAISDVLAVTIINANSPNNPLAAIISFVLQFLPLFLIPYSFKLAGGAIGQISGIMSGASKRYQEGIKGDARNPNSFRNRAKRRFGERFTAAESRIALQGKSSSATRRQQRGMYAVNMLDRGWNSRSSRYTAEATQREDQISSTGHDDQRHAANYFKVAAGQAAPTGVSDAGVDVSGSVSSSDRFFDAKGRGISKTFAEQSADLHATSEHEAGRNLEYSLRKVQTDDDLANYRRAFASTALRKGYNQDEIGGLHARASFEHKDKFPSEWYSSPKLIKGTGGAPDRIEWSDITDPGNEKGQAAQVNELHKSKESFKLSSLRDRDLRSWSDRRNRIQDQLDVGTPLSQQDAMFFAQTDELMGSLVNQGVITQMGDDGPQMSAQGVNASSAGVLRAMAKNRRYKVSEARSGTSASGDPLVSVNERVIYNEKAVDAAVAASVPPTAPGAPPARPTLSREDAIDKLAAPIIQPLPRGTVTPPGIVPLSTVGKSVAVTGDSQGSIIPRSFSN